MDKLHGDIVQISDIVHTLSRELHDARLTYIGLVAAARGFCRDVGERHKIDVEFKHDSLPNPCPLRRRSAFSESYKKACTTQ